jgi:hypothetical protein
MSGSVDCGSFGRGNGVPAGWRAMCGISCGAPAAHVTSAIPRRLASGALATAAGGDPAQLWAFYLQLVEVEQAFKELKGDLAIRPIYHRIETHIFVAFLAYCLQVTLKQRLRSLAPGLTPRSVLDKMAAIQMSMCNCGRPHCHTVSIHRTGDGSGHLAPATEDQSACPVAAQGARR